MSAGRFFSLFLAVAVCVRPVLHACPAAAAADSSAGSARARSLLARIDDLWRAGSSHGIMTMRVVTRHYRRTLKLEEWSRGTEETLIRILAPARERGTVTLKSGKVIYTWLPRTDRTIRLTGSMMAGSWMGSHFTNDDLVKEYRLSEDYDPELVSETVRNGARVALLRLRPRPEAPVVWAGIDIEADLGRMLPLTARYYDEDGRLARTITFGDVKRLGGRLLPALLRVVPAEKPDEFTEVVYLSLEFDLRFPESFFSLSQLRRW